MQELLKTIYEKIKNESFNYQAYEDLYLISKETIRTDTDLGVKYLKSLSIKCERAIFDENLSEEDIKKVFQLHKRVLLALAPEDFDSYMLFVEWEREPKSKFYAPRRKQLKSVVDELQALADGKLDLLCISTPPGVGKLVADDCPVFTKNGWKKHGDLVVGDYVIGLDGKYKMVEHVFPKGKANCEVTFTNGEKIKCHENHEWYVYNRHRGKYEVLETKDMLRQGLDNKAFMLPMPEKLCNTDNLPKEMVLSTLRRKTIYVKSIERIEPVQGNCIQVEDGIYRVGETMLPTHNSTLAIFFLTWLAGKYPDEPMLTGSHSNAFVRGVYDECLRIIKGNGGEYLWGEVFPHLNIAKTNAKDCRIDIGKSKRFETLEFTSIGTGNAGLYRAKRLLYCDDLVSGLEVALSNERLEKLWETYTTDLRQRKIGDHCGELHIATRWATRDVIGRLEGIYGDSDRAKFIVMPAVDENDESNFDYPYGLGFNTEFYHKQRDIMDDVSWRALYMNEPIERYGLVYPEDELRRYYELPDIEPDAIIGICDTKDRGSDYAFLPAVYVYGQDYYIEDCICDNNLPEIVDTRLVDILVKHKIQACRFESNSAGGRVAEKVRDGVKERNGNTHITTKYTTQNKETKIIVNSSWVKEHCLFKDRTLYKKNSDYGRMINFLCSYTMIGKNKHDDVPDGMAMLSEFAQSLSGSEVKVFQRPW